MWADHDTSWKRWCLWFQWFWLTLCNTSRISYLCWSGCTSWSPQSVWACHVVWTVKVVSSGVGLSNILSRMLHSNVILLNWFHPNCFVLDGVDGSNLSCRTWWIFWGQVPHLAGSSSGSGHQLRWQHRYALINLFCNNANVRSRFGA